MSADDIQAVRQQQATQLEMVGRMAGGVAHELNNLLAVVSGYTEIMLLEPTTALETRESLEAIHEASARGVNLTRRLLDFARHREWIPVTAELSSLVLELGPQLRSLTEARAGLKLAIGHTGSILMDREKLQQILVSLVTNAVEALPGSGGTVQICTGRSEWRAGKLGLAEGEYAWIRVEDDGCGIEPAALQQVWEPYYSTKGSRGRGLGLALVHALVMKAGGGWQLTSQPGQGTAAELFFPVLTGA